MAPEPAFQPCEELEQGNASTTGPALAGPVVEALPDSYKARFLRGQEKSGGGTRGTMTGGSPVHTTGGTDRNPRGPREAHMQNTATSADGLEKLRPGKRTTYQHQTPEIGQGRSRVAPQT